MRRTFVIWKKKNEGWKRVLIVCRDWDDFSYITTVWHFTPNWKGIHFWFWNFQFFLFGCKKCNSNITFRVCNIELDIGW